MSRIEIKARYHGDMKRIVINEVEYEQFLSNLKKSFQINGNICLKLFELPQSEPIRSLEQLIDLFKKGNKKYEVEDIPESVPTSVKNEPKKILEDEKVKVDSKSKFFQLNPAILEKIFKKLLTSDSAVVALIDFLNKNKKNFFDGDYNLKDYAQSLKLIEVNMKEATEKTGFVMNIHDGKDSFLNDVSLDTSVYK